MDMEKFLDIYEHHYEMALQQVGGGWFDGACWHLASASYDVLKMTGHDVALCHVSRNPDKPDHAVVRLINENSEINYLDADGLQTADQLIEKMKIEGCYKGDWHIVCDDSWNTSGITESPLSMALRAALFTALDPTYYHVTPADNLPSILEHGILPSIGIRSLSCNEMIHRVYCFPSKFSCENALENWLGDQFDDDDELVIIEIKAKYCPDSSDTNFEVAFERPILGEEINCVYSEDWALLNQSDLLSGDIVTHTPLLVN